MHPAFSVIFLTTLIGAGQGLFLALYTAQVYAAFNLLPAQDPVRFYALGSLVALLLLVAGLAGFVSAPGTPGARLALGRHVAHLVAVARSHCIAGLHGRGCGLGPGSLRRLEPDAVHVG